MKKIVAVIQARYGARRLPGKVLLGLEGKTVLERVVERVRKGKLIEEVMVATTLRKEDLKIVKLCSKNGVRVYRGSENDVLDRYYQAAKLAGAKHIVRITADCPLIDPGVIDRVIRLHLRKKADYTSNVVELTFPDGEDVEVFTFETLEKAWRNARLSSEREHVTSYIRNHPRLFKVENLNCDKNISHLRWTLDERKDYEFIKLVYKGLFKKDNFFGMAEILDLLEKHPEYGSLNSRIKRNEGYLKSLGEDKIVNPDII